MEDETLFGLVEDTGFEDDTAEDITLESGVTEDMVLEPDMTEDTALEPDMTEDTALEPDTIGDEALLDLAEDSAFEEDATCGKLLDGTDEAVSFAEKSSKFVLIVEFAGNSPLEQLVISITAAKAKPAHIILFKIKHPFAQPQISAITAANKTESFNNSSTVMNSLSPCI